MKRQILAAIALLMATNQAFAENEGLPIQGYGKFFKLKNLDIPAPVGQEMKVVFDVYEGPEDRSKLNSKFNTPARYLNMHVDAGMKLEDLKTVLVVHGKGTESLLMDEHHIERFGVPNPNAELLEKLHNAGVRVVVCGQSAEYRKVNKENALPFVEFSLSALTALVTLQQDGYALIPW